ncbi:hypothetical protein [Streptomyces pseudoechinosporeus]
MRAHTPNAPPTETPPRGNVQRVLRATDFTVRAAQQRRGPSTVSIAQLDG